MRSPIVRNHDPPRWTFASRAFVFRTMLRERAARRLGRVRRALGLKRKNGTRRASDAKLRQCRLRHGRADAQVMAGLSRSVMAGLVPAIHVLLVAMSRRRGCAGPKPAHEG